MKKIAYSMIAATLILFVAFNDPQDKYFELVKSLDIFGTLFKEVNTYYVDEVTPNDMIETGINSMLKSLDPYTNYIPEDQIEDYRTMTTGQYGGIGATIGTRDGKALVLMPFEGFAAQKAGLQIGDQVLKINGIDLEGKNTTQISQLLKGQAKTALALTIKRFGVEKPFELSITRENITISNVTYSGMVSNEVGLIRLEDFTNDAGKEVQKALNELKEKGAKNIILDLRGNPGGLLSEAINVSNVFIPKGNEVVSTKGKVKEWNKTYTALNAPADLEIPLVVLTNKGSASAAEIVAGVMQDYDRGVLIGQNSYGKGLVQATRSLSYNSKLKVTVAKYYIPSGRCIQAIDYTHRNPDGSVGKVADSLRSVFKTKNNREVMDGGGVKPDIELEKFVAAPITNSLESKGLLFDFATEYKSKNKQIKPAKDFKLSEEEYQVFVKWLANKEYDYTTKVEKNIEQLIAAAKEDKYFEDIKTQIESLKTKVSHNKESDLNKFKAEIKEALEAEIVSRYYLEKGSIEATFDDDLDVKEAIKLFKDLPKYNKILGKKQ